ncbi:MAG: DUF938 domain-containing protein [Synechococcaceae cyanobacterium SM2_3_1]|nr:DUF938 domain-containing protein [Synechococcaceae cyanobacterium SM2_3_1]
MLPSPEEQRRFAPATQRNRDPILACLQRYLPPEGTVLEVASGTGEHAVYFAPHLASRVWQPTEADPLLCDSIRAWTEHCPATNLKPPLLLNVQDSPWPLEDSPPQPPITALVNINMIHIAPWSACLALMGGAGRLLPKGGVLYLYGPFQREGSHTAPSNAEFDQHLRLQDPAWGVRPLEEVTAAAAQEKLQLLAVESMPANNFSVIFQRSG